MTSPTYRTETPATDDIVTRLRRLVWLAAVRHDTAELAPAAIEAADEIERLRAALALAVGELSTHDPHAATHPDELSQRFLKEARCDNR